MSWNHWEILAPFPGTQKSSCQFPEEWGETRAVKCLRWDGQCYRKLCPQDRSTQIAEQKWAVHPHGYFQESQTKVLQSKRSRCLVTLYRKAWLMVTGRQGTVETTCLNVHKARDGEGHSRLSLWHIVSVVKSNLYLGLCVVILFF